MLDNVGHAVEAKGRAKGASSKSDVADLTFACALQAGPTGLIVTARKVRSVRAPFKRGDTWVFDRDTQRVTFQGDGNRHGDGDFRPTVLMERMSRAAEENPGLTLRGLRDITRGNHATKAKALARLIAEGYVEASGGSHPTHHSRSAYRADQDPNQTQVVPGPRVVPEWSPGPPGQVVPLVPRTYTGDQGPHPEPAPTGSFAITAAQRQYGRNPDLAGLPGRAPGTTNQNGTAT